MERKRKGKKGKDNTTELQGHSIRGVIKG